MPSSLFGLRTLCVFVVQSIGDNWPPVIMFRGHYVWKSRLYFALLCEASLWSRLSVLCVSVVKFISSLFAQRDDRANLGGTNSW
jgi:hypothetical protein